MSAARAFDAAVVGAGHNGLVCACYLARAGLRVGVFERRHVVGASRPQRPSDDLVGRPGGRDVVAE